MVRGQLFRVWISSRADPTKVYKVNLVTGEKTLVQELQPDSTVGVVFISPVVMTRDASRFAYSYYQVSSLI